MGESELVMVGPDYIVETTEFSHRMRDGESTSIAIEDVITFHDHVNWFRFFFKIGWHLLWNKRVRFTIKQATGKPLEIRGASRPNPCGEVRER
jgi:hypothetical protein